ncbi:MAG TPA: hypothetical protein VIR63_00175 [Pontiella sp.]
MKKKTKTIIISSICVIGVVILLSGVSFTYPTIEQSHNAVEYHNLRIDQLLESATKIEIKSRSYLNEDTPPTTVTVSDIQQIKNILPNLKVPVIPRPSISVHKCIGNIEFIIHTKTNSPPEVVRYDHAKGIYPLKNEFDPGFLNLEKGDCAKLNTFLKSAGFTEQEIGIKK